MIKIPQYLKRLPTKKEIDLMVEFTGYTGYVPYSIISDIYCMLHHRFSGTEAYDIETDYTRLLSEVISHINEKDNFNYLQVSVVVLKALSKRINFRHVEHDKVLIKIDKDETQCNYRVNLEDYSKKTIELLNIEIKEDINTVVLSDDILEILEFQNGIKSLIGKSLIEEVIEKKKMTNYSQVVKARKYKYALPTMKVNIGLRKLNVKMRNEKPVQHDKAIIMLDRSMSTASKSIYQHLVKAVLLTFLDNFESDLNEITIIEFTNKIIGTYVLGTEIEVESYIRSELSALMSSITYKNGFKQLHKYNGKTIHLITDGTADFTEELNTKIKWNILSLEHDSRLSTLANNSGGQFIKM